MGNYKCFSKADPSQEAIAITKAKDLDDAVFYFAAQKKLLIEDFLRIFSVSELER